ncbi:hypothetical protein C8R46DRAFT_1205609 [Mycena filopes]|nr:hypothetical protein C8R46DRAFT_1205609 [Mycena filopes]
MAQTDTVLEATGATFVDFLPVSRTKTARFIPYAIWVVSLSDLDSLTPSPASTPRDSPPHTTPARTRNPPSAMSKLDFPKLTGELTPTAIHGWLGRCEDTFEAWEALNPDKSMKVQVIVTLAELKKLSSWTEFAAKVKARFVPSNWRMAALGVFHAIHQGQSTFPEFSKSLVEARNVLGRRNPHRKNCHAVPPDPRFFAALPSPLARGPFTALALCWRSLFAALASRWRDPSAARGILTVGCVPLRGPLCWRSLFAALASLLARALPLRWLIRWRGALSLPLAFCAGARLFAGAGPFAGASLLRWRAPFRWR